MECSSCVQIERIRELEGKVIELSSNQKSDKEIIQIKLDFLIEARKETKESIEKLVEKVETIAQNPGKRWEKLIAAIIAAAVGGFSTLMFRNILK